MLRGFPHLPLDFRRVVLLRGAVLREGRQHIVGVRRLYVDERRFEQTLRDQVRIPTIRCRRVGVVVDGESEVPFGLLARKLEHVFAATQQFDYGERYIGESKRIVGAAFF